MPPDYRHAGIKMYAHFFTVYQSVYRDRAVCVGEGAGGDNGFGESLFFMGKNRPLCIREQKTIVLSIFLFGLIQRV